MHNVEKDTIFEPTASNSSKGVVQTGGGLLKTNKSWQFKKGNKIGFESRFKKGNISSTSFKKGHIPWNRGVNWYKGSLQKRKSKNPNWKGGKYKTAEGYIQILTPTGYRLEHRVVMENHLKRKLFKWENIHHINGIRNDNRIENLELWVKSQPSGIRFKDLIKFYGGQNE